MPIQIKGWGTLHDHPKSKQRVTQAGADLLEVMLNFSNASLELVETQLLHEMTFGATNTTKKLCHLYFGFAEHEVPDKGQLTTIRSIIRGTRLGLLEDKGSLEIHQTDPTKGATLNGYVIFGFGGKVGPIHLNMATLLQPGLAMGPTRHCNLLIHEATHRYCKTIDAKVNIPMKGEKLGYFNNSRTNVLDSAAVYDRHHVVGDVGEHITKADALKNADSYSWLVTAMTESYQTALKDTLKFKGIVKDMGAAAAQFLVVQRRLVPEPLQRGMTIFEVAA